jgi:hypothetical protein
MTCRLPQSAVFCWLPEYRTLWRRGRYNVDADELMDQGFGAVMSSDDQTGGRLSYTLSRAGGLWILQVAHGISGARPASPVRVIPVTADTAAGGQVVVAGDMREFNPLQPKQARVNGRVIDAMP